MKPLPKEKLYWICQLGGWLVFIGIELSTYVQLDGFKSPLIINALVNFVLGITITHLYRLFLIKSNWLNLPLFQLIPRGIIAVIAMSSLLTSINIPLDRYTYPIFKDLEFSVFFFFGYFFNLSKFVLLWTLTYHLFQYWEKSLKAENEKYQAVAASKESAYLNLKNQLNPHFLFNSLNSIRTLVDLEPKLAKSAINQLSSLLRSSLDSGKSKTITLEKELETVNYYLAIEKIRFDQRLTWEMDVASDAKHCLIPPMMLQTIVENAVKHGISQLKDGGLIQIHAAVDHKKLIITITNSGYYQPKPNHDGIGINNTLERLKILYDDQASFSINNNGEQSVVTTLTIPI